MQNLAGALDVTTLAGGAQTLPGGPVASQEAIKELGTNGGGFFNANSAHPFESPTPFTNLFENFLLLVIPFSLPRTFGRMVGDARQGYAVLATMAVLWIGAVAATTAFELAGRGAVPEAVGAAMEGKEVRFGIPSSALFAASTTGTSTGAVNSFHDSFTAGGGGVTMLNMMLGEVSPGGVGAGLYGMLVLAVVAVFLAGLMVGRTPEYLGKKIGRREMTCAALYVLVMPTALLVGAAVAVATPAGLAGLQDDGAHGLSEVLYAFASASNNNGSAFAGLTVGDAVLRRGARAVHARRPVPADRPGARRWPARWPRSGRCPRAAGPCPPPVRCSSACSPPSSWWSPASPSCRPSCSARSRRHSCDRLDLAPGLVRLVRPGDSSSGRCRRPCASSTRARWCGPR